MNRAHPLLLAAALAVAGCSSAAAADSVRYLVAGSSAPTYLIAKGNGLAQLLVNASTGASDVAVSVLVLKAGAAVPEHAHERSSETLYIERGAAEMIIGGTKIRAKAGDAIYIPAGVLHSATVLGHVEPLRAVQIYVGPGPEMRFATGTKIDPEG